MEFLLSGDQYMYRSCDFKPVHVHITLNRIIKVQLMERDPQVPVGVSIYVFQCNVMQQIFRPFLSRKDNDYKGLLKFTLQYRLELLYYAFYLASFKIPLFMSRSMPHMVFVYIALVTHYFYNWPKSRQLSGYKDFEVCT